MVEARVSFAQVAFEEEVAFDEVAPVVAFEEVAPVVAFEDVAPVKVAFKEVAPVVALVAFEEVATVSKWPRSSPPPSDSDALECGVGVDDRMSLLSVRSRLRRRFEPHGTDLATGRDSCAAGFNSSCVLISN